MDVDPKDTLKMAETESLIWAEAQASVTQRAAQNRAVEVKGSFHSSKLIHIPRTQTASHTMQGKSHRLSFVGIQSYQFGWQNRRKSVHVDDDTKNTIV